MKAAQTGHLVLSTLHTNSAAETLTRLRNIGVPAYNVATSITLIVAQRLARCLVPRTASAPSSCLLRRSWRPALPKRTSMPGFSFTTPTTRLHSLQPRLPRPHWPARSGGSGAGSATADPCRRQQLGVGRAGARFGLRGSAPRRPQEGHAGHHQLARDRPRDGKPMTAQVVFVWDGTDAAGRKVSGELSAAEPRVARALLRRQGVVVSRLRRKRAAARLFGAGVKPEDIALFSRQMATMMRAGVPLVRAFDIVASGARNVALATIVAGRGWRSCRGFVALPGARQISEAIQRPVLQFGWSWRAIGHPGCDAGAHRGRSRARRSDQAQGEEGAFLSRSGGGGGRRRLHDSAGLRGAAVRVGFCQRRCCVAGVHALRHPLLRAGAGLVVGAAAGDGVCWRRRFGGAASLAQVRGGA